MMPIPELKVRKTCRNCVYNNSNHCGLYSSECLSGKTRILFTPKEGLLPNLLEACALYMQNNPGAGPTDYLQSIRPTV